MAIVMFIIIENKLLMMMMMMMMIFLQNLKITGGPNFISSSAKFFFWTGQNVLQRVGNIGPCCLFEVRRLFVRPAVGQRTRAAPWLFWAFPVRTPCWAKAWKTGNHCLLEKMKRCRDPGSNRGPLDLQSNALPTELSRLLLKRKVCYFFYILCLHRY